MMLAMLKACLISLCCLLSLFIIHTLHTAFRKGIRQIPGPWLAKFTIFYRISLVSKGNGVQEYRRLHEKYGDVVRVGPYHVSVNDPLAIQQIYGISSKFRKSDFYSVSPPFYQGRPLDNMFTVRDFKQHRVLRSATSQVYSMTNLRNYEPHVDECTTLFIELMRKKNQQPVDVVKYVHWFAFDVIASITFQKRLGFLDNEGDVLGMVSTRTFSAKYFAFVGQVPWLHRYLLGNRRMVMLMKKIFPNTPDPHGTLFATIEEQINQYDQEERQGRTDFLQQLRHKDDPDRANHKRDLMNHLSNNVLAGSDTTAIAIRAILYYLVKSPKIYATLRDEIDEADRKGKLSNRVTFEESQELKYLQATIKEAMRLHPSIAFPLERVVPPEGDTIGGYKLPHGTIVGVLPPLINRNRDVFGEDADSFRPERWLNMTPGQLKLMERFYTTFGHGARGCIGKNIALLEISKFVPEVLRCFDLEWASPFDTWTLTAGWFWKQNHIDLIFRPRA
ncbi:Cytochrome p-450 [Rhinocladiella similis]